MRSKFLFITISLLLMIKVAGAQIQNTHNITGVKKEVASHTTGSYGKILKWSPVTGLWTAQDDSSGAAGAFTTLNSVSANISTLTSATGNFNTIATDSLFTVSHGTPWDIIDGQYSGVTVQGKVHENLIFGQVCFMNTDGEYALTDADAVETMPGCVMALGSISANAYGLFLQTGYVCEADWATVQTKGALVYVGTDPGTPVTTRPSGTGDQIQVLGYCVGTDIMYFRPDWTLVEVP